MAILSRLNSAWNAFRSQKEQEYFITQNIVNNCPYDEGAINKKKIIEVVKDANLKIIDSGYCLFLGLLKKVKFL